MGFASAWLADNTLFPRLIDADPVAGTGIIVVIPAYNEQELSATIKSLSECSVPPCPCEVIVIVNAPKKAEKESIENNKRTISILKAWRDSNKCFFRLFYYDTGISDLPDWGVGYARKTGMDEAIRRFNAISMPDGVIASLDADCLVSENYFTELYNQLFCNKKKCGCAITIFNGRSDEDQSPVLKLAVEKYELSRRYMLFGMHYAGYPWCFNIAGSAMAVKAEAYVKTGGMNKREAGEDFWFIRKLLPLGGFFNTQGIIISHSARISLRVPFGTGVAVNETINSPESADIVCDPSLFDDLKAIWQNPGRLFRSGKDEIVAYYTAFPELLKEFITCEKLLENVVMISSNTSSTEAFIKRYYTKFDFLFGQRYMNFAVRNHNRKMNIIIACSALADKAGFKKTETFSFYSALSFYRDSEAWISCSLS